MKEFTKEELAQYNGENGNKAYVAVDGLVYDVTARWNEASHHRFPAGEDITEILGKSGHGKAVLKNYPQVGTMK